MAKQRPYPSDLYDARWELIEPVLTAWRLERRRAALHFGRPPEHDSCLAELNAVLGEGAESGGFSTARPDFTGHGLCTRHPYVRGPAEQAPLHPTATGQFAIALAVQRALHQTSAAPVGTVDPSGRTVTAGAG